jgi:sulfate adenylyltransferase large subunit
MAAAVAERAFDIDGFLERDYAKDLLRFTTAGSVDDGKSTLIGRLLYDSRNVYEDQIQSVTKASVNRSAGPIDFSLLTDGLRAEREQGITIDVAYRYFATAKRKFIIADTPGHEQYTRNMATGASTADLAILLIDARNGVLRQSRRHAYIASLLGIPQVVVAINKMDLVDYREDVFASIQAEFLEFLAHLNLRHAYFLPISALNGDNVVDTSRNMPWFRGPNLLEYLETVRVETEGPAPFRFPVQRVVRPNQDFRGYAGQIASGVVRPGDAVIALPSGRRTRIESIVTFDGKLDEAQGPMPVTVTLEDEIDISRGDLIASASEPPQAARLFEADMVWMSEQPLDPSRTYLLKHTTQTVPAEITALRYAVNIQTLEHEPAERLDMNGIGVLRIQTARPIFFDSYRRNRITGSFILIDPVTNGTAGAGMIRNAVTLDRQRSTAASAEAGPVTAAERMARYCHAGVTLRLGRRAEVASLLERRLFERGCAVVLLQSEDETAAQALENAGLIVLMLGDEDVALPKSDSVATHALYKQLEESGILLPEENLTGGGGI